MLHKLWWTNWSKQKLQQRVRIKAFLGSSICEMQNYDAKVYFSNVKEIVHNKVATFQTV